MCVTTSHLPLGIPSTPSPSCSLLINNNKVVSYSRLTKEQQEKIQNAKVLSERYYYGASKRKSQEKARQVLLQQQRDMVNQALLSKNGLRTTTTSSGCGSKDDSSTRRRLVVEGCFTSKDDFRVVVVNEKPSDADIRNYLTTLFRDK